MQILIISDIHANLTALKAVLADADTFDAVWCLGDLVGYGPDPNECVDLIRELPNLQCVLGNHDAAALREIDSAAFNPEARQAIHWTQDTLKPDNLAFLHSLPERIQIDQVTLVHGSPRQPIWEYLLDTQNATRSFHHFDTDYCFVGHSHLPLIYHLQNGKPMAGLVLPEPGTHILLSPRAIMNPGSVGQPRDRDSRASYALFDLDGPVWTNFRVNYDIHAVQQRMKAASLPERHILRLSTGL